jgi:hypothetical protein
MLLYLLRVVRKRQGMVLLSDLGPFVGPAVIVLSKINQTQSLDSWIYNQQLHGFILTPFFVLFMLDFQELGQLDHKVSVETREAFCIEL